MFQPNLFSQFGRKSPNGKIPCPHPNKTPAISAVLEDASFFHCLLKMLSSIDHHTITSPTITSNVSITKGRKRSISGNDMDKTIKKMKHNKKNNMYSTFHQNVFAATVLFASIRHLDHWPAPLIKVYAEDCFGDRLWVDDPKCQHLSHNLSLVHNHAPINDQQLDSANLMAARFTKYSNYMTSDLPSIIINTPIIEKRNINIESSDSDSGDEEIIVESSSTSTSSKSNYIHSKSLNLTIVRPRFIGSNLLLAYQFITDALTDQLKSKTRHYSQLLTTLQHFTFVPGIRRLIAQNLERWLQSPALSGLARTLFASIVKHMTNKDPALQEDTDCIDFILSMNVKANQVSAPSDINFFKFSSTISFNYFFSNF